MMDTKKKIKKLNEDHVKIMDRAVEAQSKLTSYQLKLTEIETRLRYLKKGKDWCDRCMTWVTINRHPCFGGR